MRILDPFSSDAALFAVSAIAGAAWEAVSDPEKRRGFWDWWLAEVLPEAWRAAVGDGTAR